MVEDQRGLIKSIEVALESVQPVRDLAKNFDIDISTPLEEFLQDLVGEIADELPPESLNFTQAALVLQNSSHVYGRKVEYLYTLVRQVQEEISTSASNKTSVATAGSRRAHVDPEIEEFNAFDPHFDFLDLHDVLPIDKTGNKINLHEQKVEPAGRESGGISFATTRLSLGATIATSGNASGAAHAATQQLMSGCLDTGSLRLIDGRCNVGEDGILILPGAGKISDDKIRSSNIFGSLTPRNSGIALTSGLGTGGASTELSVGFGGDDFGHGDDDYDDNGGGGFTFSGDDEGENMDTLQVNQHWDDQSASTPTRAPMQQEVVKGADQKQKKDPWALLDPHSQGTAKAAPLRIGKTYRLPPAISSLPSECVTGARTKRHRKVFSTKTRDHVKLSNSRPSFAVETFVAKLAGQRMCSDIFQSAVRNKSVGTQVVDAVLPEIPLKGLVYGDEFAYIAKATAKLRNERRREKMKTTDKIQQGQVNEIRNGFQDDHFDEDYDVADFGGDDDSDGGGFGFGGDNDDQDGNTGNMGNMNGMFDQVDAEEAGELEEESKQPKSFAELCRAHIQSFAKGAEKYATQTNLSKRVGDWHERLVPILEEEENRPEFDIHAYTKRVVHAIEEEYDRIYGKGRTKETLTKVVDFEAVTRGCRHYDVCRLFLASLSLSNSGNVHLKHMANEQNLRIELLNNEIERPMETYLAPSVLDHNTSM